MTVVEWGQGKVEALAGDRLMVHIARQSGATGTGGVDDDTRQVSLTGVGERWDGLPTAGPLVG